jgi:hypothetical protein
VEGSILDPQALAAACEGVDSGAIKSVRRLQDGCGSVHDGLATQLWSAQSGLSVFNVFGPHQAPGRAHTAVTTVAML